MPLYEAYCCAAELVDRYPGLEQDGRPLDSGLWLSLLNCEERGAKATVTFYQPSAPPASERVSVAPRRAYSLPLHTLLRRPPSNTPFALRVASAVPLSPCLYQARFDPWERVERAALLSVLRPLASMDAEQDTRGEWRCVLPFCRFSFAGDRPWYERELLHLLNPHEGPARVTLASGGEAGGKVYDVGIGPGRLRRLDLSRLFGKGRLQPPSYTHRTTTFSLEVRSDRPLGVQAIRELRRQGEETPHGLAAHGECRRGWTAPSGRPEGRPASWLLCVTRAQVSTAAVALQGGAGPVKVQPLGRTTAGSQLLLPESGERHVVPAAALWDGERPAGEPEEAMTALVTGVTAAPEVVSPARLDADASFRPPTLSLPPCPSPGYREWRSAGGLLQDGSRGPVLREDWVALANALDEPAEVSLTVYLPRSQAERSLQVPASGCVSLRLADLGGVPPNVPFGLRAVASGPVVVWHCQRIRDGARSSDPGLLAGDLADPITPAAP